MTKSAASFDRDITLSELLRVIPNAKLKIALTKTLGNRWQIVDRENNVALRPEVSAESSEIDSPASVPLRLDIETIGTLFASDAPRDRIETAAAWLELVLVDAHRYCMVADLHIETVNADYQTLQRKHAALQESEARYRALATQLEQRVKAQVEVIERNQRQLYQTEKMASIGSLAAGMAHEINNPIGFIRSNLTTAIGYVETMHKALDAFHRGDLNAATSIWQEAGIDFTLEDFPTLLTESAAGADRIARIVANLKAFSNVDHAPRAAVDLNDAVQVVTGLIKDQLCEDIVLTLELQPLPKIECDQGRINQVLLALLQNAVQAVQNRGQIRLLTGVADDEIRVAVIDNGCGVSLQVRDRIFDPFFTTQDVGQGTGLGLTVSRDIVTAYGGRIEVKSTPGAGSTFTICLPIIPNEKAVSTP